MLFSFIRMREYFIFLYIPIPYIYMEPRKISEIQTSINHIYYITHTLRWSVVLWMMKFYIVMGDGDGEY